MSWNPSGRSFYCDLAGGYIGDDCVLNEDVFLFVEYCDLAARYGYMVEDNAVGELVLTLMPEYFDLTV